MEWVNTILQGVLLGGLYALFAAGLGLIGLLLGHDDLLRCREVQFKRDGLGKTSKCSQN